MVEKAKGFKVDDKVFGKVKGYPAWPARVTSTNGKRYGVVFYGTNETAMLKQDDMFYYLRNKTKFPMQKRRFYAEAITDIELDIKKCGGSDGNDNPLVEEEPAQAKATKRKRNSLATNKKIQEPFAPQTKRIKVADQNRNLNDLASKAKDTGETEKLTADKSIQAIPERNAIGEEVQVVNNTARVDNPSENVKSDFTRLDEPNKMVVDKVLDSRLENEMEEKPSRERSDKSEELQNVEEAQPNPYYTDELPIENMNLLSDFYFTAITTYAERVQNNSHFYKISKPDPISLDDSTDTRIKVLPVKVDSDKYCGLIYAPKPLDSYSCEFERAIGDAKMAKELVELKEKISEGKVDMQDARFIKNLGCDDAYVQDAINQSLIAYKKSKFEWLRREMEVFKSLVEVKKCLGLQRAKPKEAIALLRDVLAARIEPVSLKKRAFFVDAVVRLRRYIGNNPDWQLDVGELDEFEKDAKVIRALADELFEKIVALFDFGTDDFLDRFDLECEHFNKLTKGMSEAEVFALCAEPLSRKAQWELILEEQATTTDSDGTPEPAIEEDSLDN